MAPGNPSRVAAMARSRCRAARFAANSDGILLSEVAFGEGHMDLPQVAAMMQKNDPRMLFQLEMITRVPHPPPHRLNR